MAGVARASARRGSGDPFFPLAGNGGYDVGHYGLALDYDPATRQPRRRRPSSRPAPRSRLARFDLDLRGFDVTAADGRRPSGVLPARGPGAHRHAAAGAARGRAIPRSPSRYAGVPEVITDPDGSIEGWVPTDDGAFVVGEPQGAPGWFPANDNPRDKATYDIAITVPAGPHRGRQRRARCGASHHGGRDHLALASSATRWRPTWPRRPTARFTLTQYARRRAPGLRRGRPDAGRELASRLLDERARRSCASSARSSARTPSTRPARSSTTRPTSATRWRRQTKPNYDCAPDETTLVHELAHQWFGDCVSAAPRGRTSGCNEGFAT